jgi:type II secretory pathway pseudopilin PulG
MKPRSRGDAGETLVEILIAVIILGGAVAGIVAALASDIAGSVRHRSRATSLTILEKASEYTKAQPFPACNSTPNAVIDVSSFNDGPYHATATVAKSINPTTGAEVACVAGHKLHVVTVTVTGIKGGPDTVDVVMRQES